LTNFELSRVVYSSNIQSIVSIYNDSDQIRKLKTLEFEERLKIKTWTNEEFEEYSHYKFHFDWLLMQSLFVSGFSYFENFMRSIAIQVEKAKGGRIKLTDIRGQGYLDTYRKYIHLIGEIDAAKSDQMEWQSLLEFKEVRNSITHESGRVKRKIGKVAEHDIYYGPSETMIRIKKIGFLQDFVNISTNYMKIIGDEIQTKNYGNEP
jgi:hypothetical protein